MTPAIPYCKYTPYFLAGFISLALHSQSFLSLRKSSHLPYSVGLTSLVFSQGIALSEDLFPLGYPLCGACLKLQRAKFLNEEIRGQIDTFQRPCADRPVINTLNECLTFTERKLGEFARRFFRCPNPLAAPSCSKRLFQSRMRRASGGKCEAEHPCCARRRPTKPNSVKVKNGSARSAFLRRKPEDALSERHELRSKLLPLEKRSGAPTALNGRLPTGSKVRIYGLAIFLLLFAFLSFFADKTGYEGDDLNSVLPMLHLSEALAGDLEIYRFDWQPLSYVAGATLIDLTGTPLPAFLLPSFAIALALAMLYGLLARVYGVPPVIFACLVMLSPEILFSGLYYNSVALGYAGATGALVLTYRPAGPANAISIGCLLGLAVLLRLDFVLIIPAMLVLGWIRSHSLWMPFLSSCTAAVILLTALGTGFMRLPELLAIYEFHSTEIAAMANSGGWNAHTKAFVASTVLSPLGFLYYGIGTAWLVSVLPRREVLSGLAVAVTLMPALMSLPDILSAKYMLPSFVFLPLLGGRIWYEAQIRLGETRHWLKNGLIAGTVFLCLAAIDIDNDRPYVWLSFWESRQIHTHDGPRSWGAYLGQMARVERIGQEQPPGSNERLGQTIADSVLAAPGKTIVFIGEDSAFGRTAIGWRHAALSMAYAGFPGAVAGTGLKVFDTPAGSLWLSTSADSLPAAVYEDPETTILYAEDPRLSAKIIALSARSNDS